jgi:quercetin dioxygenase-like cupin family protein
MPALERKDFAAPDETRPFADKGGIDLVTVGGSVVGRATFEPGWRWSEHVGPLVGRTSCVSTHVGVVLSGRQGVRMDDGTEIVVSAGDIFCIPPGHDGWTVGDEPCVVLDFAGAAEYARPD